MKDQASTNLTERLVAELLQWMQRDVIVPGTKLPSESQLIEQFGVSRTVVREAISQLKAQGIVRSYQGKGSYVLTVPSKHGFEHSTAKPQSLPEWLSFLEFRTAVEVASAGLAATRRTPQQLDLINAALEQILRSANNPADSITSDYAFHHAVSLASGNQNFSSYIESLGTEMFAVPKARVVSDAAAFAIVYQEHVNIYQAIERQDVQFARSAMLVHLQNSAARLATH